MLVQVQELIKLFFSNQLICTYTPVWVSGFVLSKLKVLFWLKFSYHC